MEVLFNSHRPDIFAVANSNVSFYNIIQEYDEQREIIEYGTNLFLSKNTDINTDVKHIAWHPSLDYCDIVAFGQSNGRVSLQSVEFNSPKSFLTGEYAPKHSRQCNALAWNKFSPYYLAIGLEKSRSGSLVIWDVNSKSDFIQGSSEKGKQSLELNPSASSQSVTKPVLELASGESVNSLAWFSHDALIAGFNRKSLRILDIRSLHGSPPSSNINHKATFGLCRDPTMENRFACYGNSLISVWDLRNFSKPVGSIPTHQNISKIEWSPIRSGMLAVLTTSSEGTRTIPGNDAMYVYEILNATFADHELEVNGYQSIMRTVKPEIPVGDWVSGFAWLPTTKNYLLTISNVSSFHFCRVPERTSVCWRNQNNFAISREFDTMMLSAKDNDFPNGKNTQSCVTSRDISSIIYQRVKNGYGVMEDSLDENVELSLEPDNKNLHSMWQWIERMKRLSPLPPHPGGTTPINSSQSPGNWATHPKSRTLSAAKHPPAKHKPDYFSGVQNILKDSEDNAHKSTVATIPWIGVAATKSKVYTSYKRAVALLMCDWGDTCNDGGSGGGEDRFGRNSVGEGLVRRVQLSGATERACTIALWHLDMKLAIEILNLASKNTEYKNHSIYSAVAMALSGYTGLKCPTLWLDTCRRLQKELESPYLQMAFAFLIACSDESKDRADEKFDLILSNKDLLLQDKVAFACMYLPDELLSTYINSLADDVIKKGSLDGILVVGLSTLPGVALLQQYIDNTGDVQTPLVAIVHTYKPVLLQHNADVQHWKSSYGNLLNKWELYFERVDFDLLWTKASNIQKTSSQVYVHCNYCNKNISNATVTPKGRSNAVVSETPTNSPQLNPHLFRHNSDPSYHKQFLGQYKSRGRGFIGGGLGYQNSVRCCPSCRKPLPRCSVCSMHLGTRHNESDLSEWISWCTRCRHGGHQGHLKEWFQQHIRCPVTDCNCCCMCPTRPQPS